METRSPRTNISPESPGVIPNSARASSVRNTSGDRCTESACWPMAAAAKSIDSAISSPDQPGRNSAVAAPACTRTGRSTSSTGRGASWATMPAQSSRNTKSAAEPSRIGSSGPSTSTRKKYFSFQTYSNKQLPHEYVYSLTKTIHIFWMGINFTL